MASHRNPILIYVCESFFTADTDEEGHVCVRCFYTSTYSTPTKTGRSIRVTYHWEWSSGCVFAARCVLAVCIVLHVHICESRLGRGADHFFVYANTWWRHGSVTAVESQLLWVITWQSSRRMQPRATAEGSLSPRNEWETHQLAPVPMATLLMAAALLTLHQRGGKSLVVGWTVVFWLS